jgi:cytochrome c-type biogenesis protein CcmE
MKSPSKKFFFSTLLIVLAVGYLVTSTTSQTLVYYYTVEEVQSQLSSLQSRGIRINGKAEKIETQGRECRFQVVGEQESLTVVYQGLLPDTFKEGSEVVIEGRWDPARQHFKATTVLAKCPSKYEGADDGEGHPIS